MITTRDYGKLAKAEVEKDLGHPVDPKIWKSAWAKTKAEVAKLFGAGGDWTEIIETYDPNFGWIKGYYEESANNPDGKETIRHRMAGTDRTIGRR